MAVALADHLGGRAELAGGAVDGGGGAKAAQLEFEDRGGMAVGKGDRVQLPEAITATEMIAQFRILVPEDAPVSELEVAGKEGADSELGRGADNGEGCRFNPHLAGPLPFPPAPDGEAFRPA